MRPEDEDQRSLFLVDTEGKADRVDLPSAGGNSANPMMQASRTSIVYLNGGVLRVMASDGSGDRKLFDRDPAGCETVVHASWSLADANQLVIVCRVSKTRNTLSIVGMDGRLIRRLEVDQRIIGDIAVSPDGQTVLFWSSDDPDVNGGSLYTLPLIGTGAPKRLTKEGNIDGDPAWSPDGTQIAFTRTGDKSGETTQDVYVMTADGSGARAVADTRAEDFKPSWSPDAKNLLIISNRKSDQGGPRKLYDLWLTRISDGEVLSSLGLDAEAITRPFWTMR
jgi:WD40 repeat protein